MTKLLEEKELAEIRDEYVSLHLGGPSRARLLEMVGALLSHVDALKACYDGILDAGNKALVERDSLSQRLAASERDAARYRWLRESQSARLSVEIDRPGFGENQGRKWWCAFKTPEQLDNAIDEARAALSSQEQKCETCGGDGAVTKKTHDSEEFIVDCPRCSPSATSTQKCETCGDTKLVTIKTWPGGIEVDNDDQPCPDCVCYAPKHCNCNKCLAAFAHLRLPSATEK